MGSIPVRVTTGNLLLLQKVFCLLPNVLTADRLDFYLINADPLPSGGGFLLSELRSLPFFVHLCYN